MNKILVTLQKKWPEYLIEIFVIIFGILGAFMLNNWYENRKDRLEERKIIENINQEFNSNRILLDSTLVRIDRAIHSLTLLLRAMNDTTQQRFRGEGLDSLLARTSYYPKWQRSNLNIREIESSGHLSKLRSKALKNLLYEWLGHMETMEGIEKNGESSNLTYINYIKEHGSWREIDKYIFEEIGTSTLKPSNDHLMLDFRFENIIDDQLVWLKHRGNTYKFMRTQMLEVINASSRE